MKIITTTKFAVKMSGSTTPFYLSIDVVFVDSKSSSTYILVSKILTRNNENIVRDATRQATSNTVHSTSDLKFIIRYKTILIDVTFTITTD